MQIKGSTALVTGASRGIGRAFVEHLLERGVAKVYVTARKTSELEDLLGTGDNRMIALALDVTDEDSIERAAIQAKDVTLLINNAGFAAFTGAISAVNTLAAKQEMEVNYFGTLAVTRAFAPALAANGGGTIVNMLSMLSLVSLPLAATYSASKAASLSLTRSLRAELASEGIKVFGILVVQTETAMGASLPEPRLTPSEVVDDALDAVDAGTNEEVIAGSLTKATFEAFSADPKGFQAKASTRLPRKN
jgi:short-subunit dehydrogenase